MKKVWLSIIAVIMILCTIFLMSLINNYYVNYLNKKDKQTEIINEYTTYVYACEDGCLNQLEILYGKPIPNFTKKQYMQCAEMCWNNSNKGEKR